MFSSHAIGYDPIAPYRMSRHSILPIERPTPLSSFALPFDLSRLAWPSFELTSPTYESPSTVLFSAVSSAGLFANRAAHPVSLRQTHVGLDKLSIVW